MLTPVTPIETTNATVSTETAIEASSVRKPLSWSAALTASQRATPIASLARTVFATWELCENILKHLSCTDLERIRGLNPTCNAVANRSLSLQQTRYLEPRSMDSARKSSASSAYDQLLINPHVENLFNTTRQGNDLSFAHFAFELHPMLKVKRGEYLLTSCDTCGRPGRDLQYKYVFDVEFRDVKCLAAISRHASLNDMFLSQSPVQNFRVHIMDHVKQKHRFGYLNCVDMIILDNESGITFSKVFEKVGQSIRRFHDATVGLMTFV